MPVNTTTLSGTGPDAVSQARAAWAIASRDDELARWNALYDRAVPAPATSMTTWERYEAGWPARDADERARYRELDQCGTRCDTAEAGFAPGGAR
jgi:hypothetical protein